MASVALAIEQAASRSKKLWWDSHRRLWEDLEELCSLEGGAQDQHLLQKRNEMEKRLLEHRHWLLNMILCFKPPNSSSREALNSSKIVIGSSSYDVTPLLLKNAVHISKHLDLDEIQSFCLLRKVLDEESCDINDIKDEALLLQNATMAYFLERQCLLKCTRCLLTFSSTGAPSSSFGDTLAKMIKEFIQAGLEEKVLENVRHVLTAHPQKWDPAYADSWSDEIALEQALLMDLLFNTYYSSLCPCKGSKWKELLEAFKELIFEARYGERLVVTKEAENMVALVRHQALLVLILTLDFRTLLSIVQSGNAFSEGEHAFASKDLQEIDAAVSSLDLTAALEYAPLLLAWATFLCLVSSLPDQAMVLDIEHAAYAQQAYKGGAYSLLIRILQSEAWRDSDFQIFGYKESVKMLTSACLAAYDFSNQADNFQLVELISEAYDGEDVLCTDFWDKGNHADGPIRNFLFVLRNDFPYRMLGLLRVLKSLCSGSWPAECVYNFLSKSYPVTFLYHPSEGDLYLSTVHISTALQIPGCSGLYVPAGAAGQVLNSYQNGVVLVRWECEHSALVILLAHMTQWVGNSAEAVGGITSLLNRMLSWNKKLARMLLDIDKSELVAIARMDGRVAKTLSLDVVGGLCSVIRNLYLHCSDLTIISESIDLLRSFVPCSPSDIIECLDKAGFEVLTRAWLSDQHLYVKFLKFEQGVGHYPVTLSVLEIVTDLIAKGTRTDSITSFVLFATHNLLVNHGNWKFKERHQRWAVSAKLFQLMRTVLCSRTWHTDTLKSAVFDAITRDSIIHGVLLFSLTIDAQGLEELYYNRLYQIIDINWLVEAIQAALELVDYVALEILRDDECLKESSPAFVFCQSLFQHPSSSASLVSVVASYLSYDRHNGLQILGVRVLDRLCELGFKARPRSVNVGSYISSSELRRRLRKTLQGFLHEEHAMMHDGVFYATLRFLDTVVKFQTPMAEALLFPWEPESAGVKPSAGDVSIILDVLWKLLTTPFQPSKRYLESTSSILQLLASIWEGAPEYLTIIHVFRKRDKFGETLVSLAMDCLHQSTQSVDASSVEGATLGALCFRCQYLVYQIMIHDTFMDHVLDSKPDKGASDLALRRLECFSSQQLKTILQSYASCSFDEKSYRRLKVVIKAFVVGLFIKLLSGDERGLHCSLAKRLHELSSQVISHAAFKDLVSQYNTRGYKFEGSLELLVMTDLYYNLRGELEGRKITSPSFQHLSDYLSIIEAETALFPISTSDGLSDTIDNLKSSLGLDCWTQDNEILSLKAAEQAIYEAGKGLALARYADAQLMAIDAFADLLKVFSNQKPMMGSCWEATTLVTSAEAVCSGLEKAVIEAEVQQGRALYLPKIVASLSRLLFVLLRQLVTLSANAELQQLARTYARSVRTCSVGMKLVTDSHIVKNLLGCLLISLEATSSLNSSASDTTIADAFVDIALVGMGYLEVLCCMASRKDIGYLCLATINVLIRSYLVSSTWLPELQQHFPTKQVISSLADEDTDDKTCGMILRLCLYLSRYKDAAEMLFRADLLHYLLAARNRLSRDVVDSPFFSPGDVPSQQSLWSIGVALMASLMRRLGDNDGHRRYLFESAVGYLTAEKQRILSTLCTPPVSGDRNKAQRPQTSSASLQETFYVSALLCEIVRHRVQTLQPYLLETRERVVHLLAYIAREGLVRAVIGVSCPPLQREEVAAHSRPSLMGSKSAWFLLCAQGASTAKESTSEDAAASVPVSVSEYSESMAVLVYKIVNFLLKFLLTQALQAVQDVEEGRPRSFPELPAPEVLHALQDQALIVASELAAKQPAAQGVVDTFRLLLNVLEKSLYLEACVSRVYGITPVSLRADDFQREYKALSMAAKDQQPLGGLVASLKDVASFVYPGVY